MNSSVQAVTGQTNELRIRFVEQIAGDDVALISFADPAQSHAIVEKSSAQSAPTAGQSGDLLDVVLLPSSTASPAPPIQVPDAASSVYVKYRGVELAWYSGHAMLQCDPDQAETLLAALAEFAHYERELRRIEDEIASRWTELEQDKRLAFEVTAADLKRSQTVGERVERVLQQRIRFARIEPHLYQPATSLSAAGQKLGAELREKAWIESRLETVDAKIEVFESIYEMSSQRIGESRASHEEHILEWIVIVLLAAETLVIVAQMFWKFGT